MSTLLWDDYQQNRKRLLHLESVTEVNLRKDYDDIQKFSPSTPMCDKTIQTPSLPSQSLPSNQKNSISQIKHEHHYLNKEDKTSKLSQEITSLQKTNEALKVDNSVAKREKELSKLEITSLRSTTNELSYENDRLNSRLNCIIKENDSYIMANKILIDTSNNLKLQVDNMESESTSLKNEISRYKTNDENQQEYDLHSRAHSLDTYVYNRFDPLKDN